MTWTTDLSGIAEEVMDSLQALGAAVPEDCRTHLATLETFCSMSLEVLSKTNPSKLRAAAQNAELRRLIPPSRPK